MIEFSEFNATPNDLPSYIDKSRRGCAESQVDAAEAARRRVSARHRSEVTRVVRPLPRVSSGSRLPRIGSGARLHRVSSRDQLKRARVGGTMFRTPSNHTLDIMNLAGPLPPCIDADVCTVSLSQSPLARVVRTIVQTLADSSADLPSPIYDGAIALSLRSSGPHNHEE